MSRKLNTEEFIKRSNLTHNNLYDYSISEYTGTSNHVDIICKLHGCFKQSAYNHMNGQVCPYCSNNKILFEDLLNKYRKIHNNKYDYSKVKYTGCSENIEIICPTHGIFLQRAVYHQKHGCPKCGNVYRKNTTDFISEAKIIHNGKYNYDKSIYINNKTKLLIECVKHGDFTQTPNSHLKGRGCPTCRESTGEKIIRNYLQENKIVYEPQYKINNFLFDFYLPEYNLIVEYDGIQHFQPVSTFGGEEQYQKQIIVDNKKNKLCLLSGIKLLRIPYYEKNNIQNKIECYFICN